MIVYIKDILQKEMGRFNFGTCLMCAITVHVKFEMLVQSRVQYRKEAVTSMLYAVINLLIEKSLCILEMIGNVIGKKEKNRAL